MHNTQHKLTVGSNPLNAREIFESIAKKKLSMYKTKNSNFFRYDIDDGLCLLLQAIGDAQFVIIVGKIDSSKGFTEEKSMMEELASTIGGELISYEPLSYIGSKFVKRKNALLKDENDTYNIGAIQEIAYVELKDYIKFIDGEPVKVLPNAPLLSEDEEVRISKALYRLAAYGDAAYATSIRIILSSAGIISKQVDGDGEVVPEDTRPNTYARIVLRGLDEPKGALEAKPKASVRKPRKHRSWDRFEHAIYSGYTEFRKNNLLIGNRVDEEDSDDENCLDDKGQMNDSVYTNSQLNDYQSRKKRISFLHEKGELFARVVDSQEIIKFAGYQYKWENTTLSTSVLPRKNSPIELKLFDNVNPNVNGNDPEIIGILIDPHRASKEDYGVTFYRNAGTRYNGFEKQAERRKDRCAANNWITQKELFVQLENMVAANLPIDEGYIKYDKRIDGSGWDVRTNAILDSTVESFEIRWNETTWYRGAERDLTLGLFVIGNLISACNELRELAKIQALIRQKKGLYLPIFRLNYKTNQLKEIVIDDIFLFMLGLRGVIKTPPTENLNLLSQRAEKAGLDVRAMVSAYHNYNPYKTIRKIIDFQLMSFELQGPLDTVNIKEGNAVKEIRLIDNIHLVFPTVFKTETQSASFPDFCLTLEDINFIETTYEVKKMLEAMFTYNLKFFLGIDIRSKNTEIFDPVISICYAQNKADKKDFASAVARALRATHSLGFVNSYQLNIIVQAIEQYYPDIVSDIFEARINENLLIQKFQKIGLDDEVVVSAYYKYQPYGTICNMVDFQLKLYDLPDPFDTVNIKDGNTVKEIRLIDNLHLVFPTAFKTENQSASFPDFCLTYENINFIKNTPEVKKILEVMFIRNLKFFLGINIESNNKAVFDPAISTSYAQNNEDKKDFASMLARALNSIHSLGFVTDNQVKEIIKDVREHYPDICCDILELDKNDGPCSPVTPKRMI